jgi:uncharacterized protein YybS (DUF2232 family)
LNQPQNVSKISEIDLNIIRGEKVKNTRRLTEGAILLAIFAVLLLITLYVPLLGIISVWFLPLPFIYFSWKYDWKNMIVFLIAALMISLIVGSLFAIPLTLLHGTTGMTLGYLVQKNKSRMMMLVAATLVLLTNVLIQYGVAVVLFDFNFIKEATTLMKKSFDTSVQLLNSVGKENDAEKLKNQVGEMLSLIQILLPSLLVVSTFIIAFFIQLINFSLLKRFGLKVTHWKPFRELSLPKSILWYYLFTVILSLILNPEEGSYIHTALWNLAYILQILLVVQGLSLVFFISHLKKLPKSFPIVATVLTLIIPLVLYIIRILGIIDLGFELRKRLVKK